MIALIAFLMLLLPCHCYGQVTTVDVNMGGHLGGVSGAFFGTVAEQKFVFKSNNGGNLRSTVRMQTGNVEGEYLAARMLEQAGVDTPRVELVKIRGKKGLFAKSNFIGDGYGDSRVFKDYLGKADLPPYPRMLPTEEKLRLYAEKFAAKLDLNQVRKLQVIDVLMGNGDRHGGNIFLTQRGSGKYGLMAIDHNFAFVTQRQKPDNSTHTKNAGWQRNFLRSFNGSAIFGSSARRAGSVANIVEKNCVYRICLQVAPDRVAYQKIISETKSTFSDEVISKLVNELPEEISAKRKSELSEILKWRRDNMAKAFDDYLQERMLHKQGDKVRTWLVSKGIGCSSAMQDFLVEQLIKPNVGPRKQQYSVRVVDGYYYLRAAGATRKQALSVLEHALLYLGTEGKSALEKYKREMAVIDEGFQHQKAYKKVLSKVFCQRLCLIMQKVKYAILPGLRRKARERLQHLDSTYSLLDKELRKKGNNRGAILTKQQVLLEEYVSLLKKAEFVPGRSLLRAKNELVLRRAMANSFPVKPTLPEKQSKSQLSRLLKSRTGTVKTSVHVLFTVLLTHLMTEQFHRGEIDIKRAIEMIDSPEVMVMLPLAIGESKLLKHRPPAISGLIKPLAQFIGTAVAFEIIMKVATEATEGLAENGSKPRFSTIMSKKALRHRYLRNLFRIVKNRERRRKLLKEVFCDRLFTCEFAMMSCGAIVGARAGLVIGSHFGLSSVITSVIGGAIGAVGASALGRHLDIKLRLARLNGKRYDLRSILTEKSTGDISVDYPRAKAGLIKINEYLKYRNETVQILIKHYLVKLSALSEKSSMVDIEKKNNLINDILALFKKDLALFHQLKDVSNNGFVSCLEEDTITAQELVSAQLLVFSLDQGQYTVAETKATGPSMSDLNIQGF